MEQLIAMLFLARDIAHREHLKTTGPGSYARHMALGSFYEDIVERADSIAEAYQGRFGLMKDIPYLENSFDGDIVEILEKYRDWIDSKRYKAVTDKETSIQNLIDEAVATFDSTLYKLKFLE